MNTGLRHALTTHLALGVLEGLVLVGTKVHDDRTNSDRFTARASHPCVHVDSQLVLEGDFDCNTQRGSPPSQLLRQFHYCLQRLQQVRATGGGNAGTSSNSRGGHAGGQPPTRSALRFQTPRAASAAQGARTRQNVCLLCGCRWFIL